MRRRERLRASRPGLSIPRALLASLFKNDAGEIIKQTDGTFLKDDDCEACCGDVIIIASCEEWDTLCSGDPAFDLNVDAPGTWFEAGSTSCDCSLIPDAGIIDTTCEALFNVMRGDTTKIQICPGYGDGEVLQGWIWAFVSCEGGDVEIIIRQISGGSHNAAAGTMSPPFDDVWVGFHEWTITFAPPLSIGAPISVPWNRRVETMNPTGLFTPIGCRPTNSTMPDATITISPG